MITPHADKHIGENNSGERAEGKFFPTRYSLVASDFADAHNLPQSHDAGAAKRDAVKREKCQSTVVSTGLDTRKRGARRIYNASPLEAEYGYSRGMYAPEKHGLTTHQARLCSRSSKITSASA